MLRLVLKAAFTELFGDTTGPEETFFKLMKPSWSSLNLADYKPPTIPAAFRDDVAPLLNFINHLLEPENADLLPRDNYKEFLELALLILGETPERKKCWSFNRQSCQVDGKSYLHAQADPAPAPVP